MTEIQRKKRRIRSISSQRVLTLTASEMEHKSGLITNQIIDYINSSDITHIMSYISMRAEVDTFPIMRWAAEHSVQVAVPRITVGESLMSFHLYWPLNGTETLEVHPFGFRQPSKQALFFDPEANPGALMLVPGSAFTTEGDRVGRGGGFYDRYLGLFGANIKTVGICFSEQLFDTLPTEEHDIRLDKIFHA
jgi:5-formyltetrahydrofolate cyclo-ligase